MSTLKCTIIVIILAVYQSFQCAYAQTKLSKQAVKCINDLAAHFKVPTPFNPKLSDEVYAEILVESTKIDYRYRPYLNENEKHYEGTITLSKLMLAKGAIAHLKSPEYVDFTGLEFLEVPKIKYSEPRDIITEYYNELLNELISVGIKTPEKFCQQKISLFMNLLEFTVTHSDCAKQLEKFPQDLRQRALEYGYVNYTVTDFKDIYFGELYMKHLITNVKVLNYFPTLKNLDQPEGYCITKTASTDSSSSGNQ